MSAVASLEVLRAAERTAVPWKNGGGLTREVVVFPPGSDLQDFDWRVSIADVRTAGAFSVFVGVERLMAVISGRLSLVIDARAPLTLTPESDAVAFAGETPVFAEPLGGSVTDLNVMTRRSRCRASLTRRSAPQSDRLEPRADTTVLVALVDLLVRRGNDQLALTGLDALRIGRGPACIITGRSGPAVFHLIEID